MQKARNGFWNSIKRPCVVLAPLYDVTDPPFRKIIAKYGKPDVMFTEFVSADGIVATQLPKKKETLIAHKLKYSEEERPIVAQIFGCNPEKFKLATEYIKSIGFDGVDINMGCPERTVTRHGAGSALFKTHSLAQEIIAACKEGGGPDFPVSVKTRIGYESYDPNDFSDWVRALLDAGPDALTIHLRTMKEMSLVPAHWDDNVIERAVDLRNMMDKPTLILGNGDVKTLEEARYKAHLYGIDGVMIGRGIFGKPWLWTETEPPFRKQIEILIEHLKTYNELGSGENNYHVMKKHFTAYLSDFPGAKSYRTKLMESATLEEGLSILDELASLEDEMHIRNRVIS